LNATDMTAWWQTFFDADYLRIWEPGEFAGDVDAQVSALWTVLELTPASRVLDAPCGYGRISHVLAERGATVFGVDYSEAMIAEAERRRAASTIPEQRLSYRRHDLRERLAGMEGFDAAINLYSSFGYGSEADDRAVLETLRAAVRPGGRVFLETTHRDSVVLRFSRNPTPASRLRDGTVLVELPRFDIFTSRVETTWYFHGPAGSGEKSASFRIYTATELAALLSSAGLKLQMAYQGCSAKPFTETSGRLGLLAVRE
jgi:SAM-dependent methyltransferase